MTQSTYLTLVFFSRNFIDESPVYTSGWCLQDSFPGSCKLPENPLRKQISHCLPSTFSICTVAIDKSFTYVHHVFLICRMTRAASWFARSPPDKKACTGHSISKQALWEIANQMVSNCHFFSKIVSLDCSDSIQVHHETESSFVYVKMQLKKSATLIGYHHFMVQFG